MSIATEIERIKIAKENIINTLKANDIQIGENATIDDVDAIMNDVPILDTSDATATAGDILKDKTAYVNGEKIVGTGNYLEEIATLKREIEQLSDFVESETLNPVIIEDSADLPCKISLYGNSKYETIEGAEWTNLMDFNVTQNANVTTYSNGTFMINGTGGFNLKFKDITLKKGIKYYQKFELLSGEITGISTVFMGFSGSIWQSRSKFIEFTPTADTVKNSSWIHASAKFNNAVIRMWADTAPNEYGQSSERIVVGKSGSVEIEVNNGLERTDSNYQSQVKTLPIQEEMLEGDYIDDVEHHEWGLRQAHGRQVYYKLDNPKDLELTEEQKEVLNGFTTYRNKTNVSADGIGTLKVFYKRERE